MNKNIALLAALLEVANGYADWDVVRQAVKERQAIHVAVMAEPFLTYLLQGRKTIESRFSKHAIAPFNQIKAGDLVLLKQSGGSIVGCFIAGRALFERLDNVETLARLQSDHAKAICAGAAFWQAQQTKKYATLIEVTAVQTLRPMPLPKKDRRGWVALYP